MLCLALALPGTYGHNHCRCSVFTPPVCGTDGKTYWGWCQFHCAQKRHAFLKLDHIGACGGKGAEEAAALSENYAEEY